MRVGLFGGPKLGAAFGKTFDIASDPLAGVTKDATSGIYLPASASEWSTFISVKGLAIGSPSAVHGFQDASGNITDAVGSFTLTASGSPGYRQTESGWSRKAVTTTDGGAQQFISTSASWPDLSAGSMTTLIVMKLGSAATTRVLLQLGVSTSSGLKLLSTGKVRAYSGANSTDSTNTVTGSVVAFSYRWNKTGGTATGFTQAEKLSVTPLASSGKELLICSGSGSPAADILYSATWINANAEISDANWKAALQAMGFTITWS